MTLYFDGNFASGNTNAYNNGQIVSPQDIAFVNDPVLGAARTVVRFSVNDGDNGGVTGDNRCQLATPQLWGAGTDLWIGFGILWPSSWPDLGNGNPFRWATFAQVYGPPWNGSAFYSIDMNQGTQIEFGSYTASGNVQRGVWYDFVIHEYLSSSTNSSIAEFWVNSGSGWQYVNAIDGKPTFGSPNNGGPNYHKIACYTGVSQWSSNAYPLVVYFNQHKIGSSRADVEPNSYAGTAPGAPTGVSATAGAGQATVSWTAPSAGSSAIIDYTVTSSPGNITKTTSGSPATVIGLTNGTSYTFNVKARNSVGTGSASAASNAVTPVAAATAPGPPTGLVATAGNGQATVRWTAPASNGGSPLTTYTVTASPGGAAATTGSTTALVAGLTNGVAYTFTAVARNVVGTSGSSAASAAVTPTAPQPPPVTNTGTVIGLTNGVAYTFTVKARNTAGSGVASAPSNSVTPAGAVTTPGSPTAVVAAPGNTSATVGWTAPASNGGSAILDYTVVASPGGAAITTTALTATVPGLVNGTSYTFTVKARNSAGSSASSAASATVTPLAVGPKSGTVVGLTNGVTYTFTIKSRNSAGSSVSSAVSNPVTPTGALAVPGAPTAPFAVAGNTQATVSWVPPASSGSTPIIDYTITTVLVGATVPGAPPAPTAAAGGAQATVSFNAPASDGNSPILDYTVTSSPGGLTATGASPLVVTGLTNGTAYTFTVKARNTVGSSSASAASNSVTPTAPATAPGAPTIGTATGGNTQATVAFTAPGSNGGSPILDYTVTSSPGGRTGTSTSSPITVPSLTNGTAYTFTVKARNAIGSGSASGASNSVTPAAATTVPGVPTGVSAAGGNAQAVVTFTAPASNGGSAIIDYTVTSSPGGLTSTGAGSPRTVTGLTNGTAYTFTVKARNSVGSSSASATSNSVTPVAPGNPNLAPYSSFQSGAPTTGWTLANCTAALDTTHAYVGTASLKMTQTSGATSADVDFGPLTATKISVTAGQAYMFQGWVYSTTTATVVLGLNWYNGGAYLSSSATAWQNLSASTWTQVTLAVTAPASSTDAQFDPGMASVNSSGTVVWWDALKAEVGSTATAWTPGPSDPAGTPAPF